MDLYIFGSYIGKIMKIATKIIATNAVIAALYVVFTLPFGVIAVNNVIQFRPAEALAILPALAPHTAIGLAIGCCIANIISPFGIYDMVLGALVTLIAALLTSTKLFRKIYLAPIPPIILNALLLPLIWIIGGQGGEIVYYISMAGLLVSQSVVIYGLGTPLYILTKKKLLPYLALDVDHSTPQG